MKIAKRNAGMNHTKFKPVFESLGFSVVFVHNKDEVLRNVLERDEKEVEFNLRDSNDETSNWVAAIRIRMNLDEAEQLHKRLGTILSENKKGEE